MKLSELFQVGDVVEYCGRPVEVLAVYEEPRWVKQWFTFMAAPDRVVLGYWTTRGFHEIDLTGIRLEAFVKLTYLRREFARTQQFAQEVAEMGERFLAEVRRNEDLNNTTSETNNEGGCDEAE